MDWSMLGTHDTFHLDPPHDFTTTWIPYELTLKTRCLALANTGKTSHDARTCYI